MAQPEDLVGQRSGPGLAVAQYPHLPMEPKGLAGQLLRGLPDALRPLLLLVEARVQPGVLLVPPDHLLVEPAEFRAKRPDGLLLVRGRLQDGAPPGRSGPRPGRALTGLRCRQGLAQPGVLLAQRPGRIEGRRDAGFRKERLQARHFRLQGRHVPCRAAGFLRLFDGTQPAPAGLEPRLPRTAIAAGGHFRPAQLFRARSAASARARSRSHCDRQSRGACSGADTGDNRTPPLPSTSVRLVPKSSSRTTMRTTIAHGKSRYQRKTAPCGATWEIRTFARPDESHPAMRRR